MTSLLVVIYNLVVFCVISYAVFWKEYSGWWFVVAALFMASTRDRNKENDN